MRTLDPEPEISHPHYPVKLEAVGFGLLIPVFFVTSGVTLDVSGLVDNPSALAGVPLLVAALLVVRGLPVVAIRGDLSRSEPLGCRALQATSLPFLLTIAPIGIEMGLLERATAAALVAAGLVSVLVFPSLALKLLASSADAGKRLGADSGPVQQPPEDEVSAVASDGDCRFV